MQIDIENHLITYHKKMTNALTQGRDEVLDLIEKPFFDYSHYPEQKNVLVRSWAKKK